jgi:Na+/melibiose symporter-like transporter
VQLLTVPVYQRYAQRHSKRRAYRLAMAVGVVTFPLLALGGVIPGVPVEAQAIVLLALAGLSLAGVFLFPAALTADIVDYDTSLTGMRREASYFGSQNFVEKTATSFAPLLVSLMLLLGNTAGDPLGVRLVGPFAALLVLTGLWIFRGYDLSDDVRAQTVGAAPSGSSRDSTEGV